MGINWTRFSSLLEKLLEFKTSTTKVPIKDISWEELIWATLAFLFNEQNVEWDPQSHSKSVDIVARVDRQDVRISAKAGILERDIINISSYRLTTFSTINDMLNFIAEQHANFDYYLICAREEMSDGMRYSVFKISSSRLAPPWLVTPANWVETTSGYQLKDGFGFKAKIVLKMSNQLWYTIPKSYFTAEEGILSDFFIPYDELGRGMIKFLEENFSK